jgi:hypothetical protein
MPTPSERRLSERSESDRHGTADAQIALDTRTVVSRDSLKVRILIQLTPEQAAYCCGNDNTELEDSESELLFICTINSSHIYVIL